MVGLIIYKMFAAVVAPCPNDLTGGNRSLCNTNLPSADANGTQLNLLLAVVFGILAVVAVIFVVVGGIQFMTSGGNSEQTNKAKNTILYALIGLAVAVSAELIVNFVLSKIGGL
jgi:Type IV secretion system pilin